MMDSPKEGSRWLVVRQGPLAVEEQAVLRAVRRHALAQHCELVTVLLGTSSYDAEAPVAQPDGQGEVWLLDEDDRGRGVRPTTGRLQRRVTPDELVTAIMTAERVVQFP
jgi:hypothetical protein